MKTKINSRWTYRGWVFLQVVLICALILWQAVPAAAADPREPKQLVEKARLTLENFMADNNMGAFRDLLKSANGVLIAPSLLKAAFIVGASGGNAVLLIRDKQTGKWSDPAFYTIGGASFGLQAGGQSSEVILLLMSNRGAASLMSNSVKLGGDASFAAGPVGMGTSAATANLSADILSFSRAKGLYGGVSLEGAVVAVRGGLNEAYYGKKITPLDITVRHNVKNPQAAGLIEDISKFSVQKSAALR